MATSNTRSIAISGAGGMVGRALSGSLQADGHRVLRLTRRPARAADEISWDPRGGFIEAKKLEGVHAVVHLAGEPILGFWTSEKKERIRASRVEGTTLLANALAHLDKKPAVFVSASAVGYYGDAGDRILTEADAPGSDFLAQTCVAWEAAAQPAGTAGIRVVHPRLGIVLSPAGGALKTMLPVFRLALGGKLGSGEQWMSWIDLRDTVSALRFILRTESVAGPVNLCSPKPVRNEEFTRILGKVLSRPAFLAVPSFAIAGATGGMGDAVLLASQRAVPAVLQAGEYGLSHPDLADALASSLDGNRNPSQTV